jgi:hypothetical protein
MARLVSTPEIGNRRDAGAGRDDTWIADLQRKRACGVRLVSQRLSVTANSNYFSCSDTVFFQKCERGIAETLANPMVQFADQIDCAFGRRSRRFQER